MENESNQNGGRLWKRYQKGIAKEHRSPCPDASLLAAYLDGNASGKSARLIEEHLLTCPDCLEAIFEIRSLQKAQLIDVPDRLKERAKELVPARRPRERKVTLPLPGLRDALFLYLRRSAAWALAAAGIIIACVGGMKLGGGMVTDYHRLTSEPPLISFNGGVPPFNF